MPSPELVMELLKAWGGGNMAALTDRSRALICDQPCRLAGYHLWREHLGHATALINEAELCTAGADGTRCRNCSHFFVRLSTNKTARAVGVYGNRVGHAATDSRQPGNIIWMTSWHEHLRTHGYAHFAGVIPEPLVRAARDTIERDLATNYDPERQLEYDNQSYCPDLRGTAPITNLIESPAVRGILDEALGTDNIDWDGGQIAIRRAHNHPQPAPPWPHIDGFASGVNGLDEGKIYSLTALIGIFLTPVEREFAGNFTVWPGSHHVYERYFRERGPRALSEPMPMPEIGQPVQLMCGIGDVVLAHYELAHTAAVNTTDADRIAVYFRIWLRGLELKRWHYLTNMWDGWNV